MGSLTIHEIVKHYADNSPENTALIGLENSPISFGRLYQHILIIVSTLNDLGIGRNDCIAIILPNGAMLAAAFLCISSTAVSAPLNPAYTETEFEFYLSDLNARAVIVPAGSNSPAVNVARRLGIQILEIEQVPGEPEGLFSFKGIRFNDNGVDAVLARKSDEALILHTSGTTSRPKIVPLTQKNLCISADNVKDTLKLTADDRCLNIMPLFHIHGLVAAVLASLQAGASIACTPGFLATEFFHWLDSFKPTWYTAVPTMHQSILNRAGNHTDLIRKNPLRFIRSSSSALPPTVMEGLEKQFNAPVIEAYGMTEAAHQMASNPLPPARRKPGSIGLPAGPEIGIMAEEEGRLLPSGTVGEIVIRGQNVTLGYKNNPDANKKSFSDGWFRTGDQGYFDADGYLFLTGRLKELINRGGEKISPREVDEVLLQHPGVIQAVSFAIPDVALGEDVAAAVVLKHPGVTENDLRLFAADHLAPFKVPVQIVFLQEIPKGATGKVQRISLAEKLGFANVKVDPPKKITIFVPPDTPTERTICEVWKTVLVIPEVGVHNRFRDLGGDSMIATIVHLQLEGKFGITISLVELFAAATIAEQAKLIDRILSTKS